MTFKMLIVDRRTILSLPVAGFVLNYGFYQILEALGLIFITHDQGNKAVAYVGVAVGVISIVDGFTSILAVVTQMDVLALAAFAGYILDMVGFIIYIVLRLIKLPINLVNVLVCSIFLVNIILSVVAIPTAYALHQILLFGGTGWEHMTPSQYFNASVNKETVECLSRGETLRDKSDIEEGVDSAQMTHYKEFV